MSDSSSKPKRYTNDLAMSKAMADETELPLSITRREAWPRWRQLLQRPPEEARQRARTWNQLQTLCELGEWKEVNWPALRRPGIFGDSLVHVDQLGGGWADEPLRLRSNRRKTISGVRGDIVCPQGGLFKVVTVDRFGFDITEVEGIAASKSIGRLFESVFEFGADYATYQRAPFDASGLSAMLKHREIRLKPDGSGSDRLDVSLWDGRVFLRNSGGSHHFAGASYIAKVIGASTRFAAPLTLTMIRPQAVNWLIDEFHVLAVPCRLAAGLAWHAGALVGSAFSLSAPGHVAPSTDLLLVPKDMGIADDIVNLLLQAGAQDVRAWFEGVIIAQRETVMDLSRRFQSRLDIKKLLCDETLR